MEIATLIIALLALVVSFFRPPIDRWMSDRATVDFRYVEHPNPPRGRISGGFTLMTIVNMSSDPLTIHSLEWRLEGTGIKVAEQGTIEEYDGWHSDELPKLLPTRYSSGKWYHPTSISGEPGWEMILADKVFKRSTWRNDYRKLALYYVLSPHHVIIATMPEEFFRRVKHACELWDEHGWPHERVAAKSQQQV